MNRRTATILVTTGLLMLSALAACAPGATLRGETAPTVSRIALDPDEIVLEAPALALELATDTIEVDLLEEVPELLAFAPDLLVVRAPATALHLRLGPVVLIAEAPSIASR